MEGRRNLPYALAGIVAPIWFTLLVLIQGRLQPNYDHIALPISALAAWPLGWVQNVNFFVMALLLAVFYVGLHQAVNPARYGTTGIALLLGGCVGIFVAGLFPWVMVNGIPTETMPHVVGAVLSFFCSSVGMMIVSRRLAADPRWSDRASYVLAAGLAMLVMFIALGAFAVEDGTPLHPWAGLLQRVICIVWFTAILTLAFRLRQLDKQ
jgi:hypothetical membrane protein